LVKKLTLPTWNSYFSEHSAGSHTRVKLMPDSDSAISTHSGRAHETCEIDYAFIFCPKTRHVAGYYSCLEGFIF